MRSVRLRRWLLRASVGLALLPAGLVGYDLATDNFGTVVSGRVFRSGQMGGTNLKRTLRDHGIKTVLNLRGPNPGESWYRDELAATTSSGATHVDIGLSSREWMSRAQLRTLIRVLDASEYPLLIHCQWGSERTSLASAVSELLRPGAALADAEGQFSLRHLFVRYRDGKVMAEHLDAYEAWLRSHSWAHSPARLRQWADDGYTPREPTREAWPYDPKPLLVITRPEPPPETEPLAGAGMPRARR